MKYTERELARTSDEKPEIEGRLSYKKTNSSTQYYQSAFKQRWFKLIDNFLFYFRISEVGKIVDKQPIGVFVLENVVVQTENNQDCPFSFSISFLDEPDKKHIFSCTTEQIVLLWVAKLRCSSYEYLRTQLYILQSKIYSKTGKDPLLMVPRNAGSMRWAPGQPIPHLDHFSQLQINGKGFTSHLPDHNSMVSVQKSKSSTNVDTIVSNTSSFLELSWPGIEKCKASAEINKIRSVPFNDHNVAKFYHRAAPSPPPRKKNSPLPLRNIADNNLDKRIHSENDLLHVDFLAIQPPLPPLRRNSPKRNPESSTEKPESTSSDLPKTTSEINLIEF